MKKGKNTKVKNVVKNYCFKQKKKEKIKMSFWN